MKDLQRLLLHPPPAPPPPSSSGRGLGDAEPTKTSHSNSYTKRLDKENNGKSDLSPSSSLKQTNPDTAKVSSMSHERFQRTATTATTTTTRTVPSTKNSKNKTIVTRTTKVHPLPRKNEAAPELVVIQKTFQAAQDMFNKRRETMSKSGNNSKNNSNNNKTNKKKSVVSPLQRRPESTPPQKTVKSEIQQPREESTNSLVGKTTSEQTLLSRMSLAPKISKPVQEQQQQQTKNTERSVSFKDIASTKHVTAEKSNKNTEQQKPAQSGMQKFKLNLQKGLAKAATASRKRFAEHQQKRLVASQTPTVTTTTTKPEPEQQPKQQQPANNNDAATTDSRPSQIVVPKSKGAKQLEAQCSSVSSITTTSNPVQSPSPTHDHRDHGKVQDDGSVLVVMDQWVASVDAVLHSQEVLTLRYQTHLLIAAVGKASVQAILFPVTFLLPPSHNHRPHHANGNNNSIVAAQQPSPSIPFQGIISAPWHAWNFIGNVTGQVAGDLLSVVIPPSPESRPARGQSTDRPKRYLDEKRRDFLLLDYGLDSETVNDHGNSTATTTANGCSARPQEQREESTYLLRVIDLAITTEDQETILAYIDLGNSEQKSDDSLIQGAMDKLASIGLGMFSNHPTVRLANADQYEIKYQIDWKCEGGTARLLKAMYAQSALERLQTLQTASLVWSGTFANTGNTGNSGFDDGRQFSLYLARGMLPFSPLQLLQLLWDNSRTHEYNNFCLGRKTLLELLGTRDQDILNGTCDTASKVIQSETKVPFINFTFTVQCLMHCRPLPGGAGYVIISRSLQKGPAGTHHHLGSDNKDIVEKTGNEILWGINVIRRVPNHPHLADLTSLSQVGYSLGVPRFLASQIALKGVDEFFCNVRKIPSRQQQQPGTKA